MPLFIVIIFIAAFFFFFVYFIPVRLWISAIASGVKISLFSLIGMRLRKVDPFVIVPSIIMVHKAGLSLSSDALEAHYLAHAVVAMMCVMSPEGIMLGGSVMHQQQLFPLVRQKAGELLNDYLKHDRMVTMEDVIVPPGLGDNAGVMGAIALAMVAQENAAA